MVSFESDYVNGAHPEILEAFMKTNDLVLRGYGRDDFTEAAKEKIKKAVGNPEAEVFFLVGGTQTNSTVIASLLKNNEGVVCANTGHIAGHEAGAVEATGHKVLTLPHENGKLSAAALKKYVEDFYAIDSYDHMVFPGMVYISHPTEYGTLYSLSELKELSEVCREKGLPLYLDGARLGYGLMSYETDVTLQDIAKYCDAFYIGGTKVGALLGEAVVFKKETCPKHFFTEVKQHGALLAKNRAASVQFDALFTNGLYERIGKHGIEMAEKVKKAFQEKGYEFFMDSSTNQQFVVMTYEKAAELRKELVFEEWEPISETTAAFRFVTSWSTTEHDIEVLKSLI